jgi:hypothetical protein
VSAETPTPPPGETLTRRAVTAVTALIAALAFTVSLGNTATLCEYLGISPWIAWLIGPSVDLSVCGLLVGVRALSLAERDDAELRAARRLLRFCGLLTLALNTAESVAHRRYGTALVDAVAPCLLLGWSEVGPDLLRQLHTLRRPAAISHATSGETLSPSDALMDRAHRLDARHRAETGRPISRDRLRAELRIGRDRASELVAVIRTEAADAARARADETGQADPDPRPGERLVAVSNGRTIDTSTRN